MALNIPEIEHQNMLDEFFSKLEDESSSEYKEIKAMFDWLYGEPDKNAPDEVVAYSTEWEDNEKEEQQEKYHNSYMWESQRVENTDFKCEYCGDWLSDYFGTCNCLSGKYDNQ